MTNVDLVAIKQSNSLRNRPFLSRLAIVEAIISVDGLLCPKTFDVSATIYTTDITVARQTGFCGRQTPKTALK